MYPFVPRIFRSKNRRIKQRLSILSRSWKMLVSRFMFMVGNSFWHHRAGREGLGELMRIGLLESWWEIGWFRVRCLASSDSSQEETLLRI